MKLSGSADGFVWLNGGYEETDDHLALGGHEVGMLPFYKSFADKNKSFVNVGAHVGTWTIRGTQWFGHVYGFEANPSTFDVLRQNLYYNDLEDKVTPVCNPVYDVSGITFGLEDVHGKRTGGSTRVVVPLQSGRLTNRSVTLDDYFSIEGTRNPTMPIGLISMDVEGAEAAVLRGAGAVLEYYRPNLIVELHEGHPGTDEDLRAQVYSILDEHNYSYRSVQIDGEHMICQPEENVEDYPEVLTVSEPIGYTEDEVRKYLNSEEGLNELRSDLFR